MIKEINLKFLIKIFKHFWWKILIFAVVVAIAVGAYSHFTAVPTYSSSVKFYILNLSMTSEYTTQSLLSAAQSLANDYIEIIMGDEMTEHISNRLKEFADTKHLSERFKDLPDKNYDVSPGSIRGMISSRVSSSASTFEITITSTNPELAVIIANLIAEESAEIVQNTTKPYLKHNYFKEVVKNGVTQYAPIEHLDYDCYEVLRYPGEQARQNADATAPSAAIAGVVAAAMAYVFFMMRRLLENVIRTEENIKDIVPFPIIGSVPTWDHSPTATKYSQEDKK